MSILQAFNRHLGSLAAKSPDDVDAMIEQMETLRSIITDAVYTVSIIFEVDIDSLRPHAMSGALRDDVAAVFVANAIFGTFGGVGSKYFTSRAAVKMDTIRTLRELLGLVEAPEEPN